MKEELTVSPKADQEKSQGKIACYLSNFLKFITDMLGYYIIVIFLINYTHNS